MIPLKHYRSNPDGSLCEITIKSQHYPKTLPSVTDKSAYSPKIVNVNQRVENGSGGVGCYDFKDGVDTGERSMVRARDMSLDITELDVMLKAENAKVENQKSRAKRKLDDVVEHVVKEAKQNKEVQLNTNSPIAE